MKSTPLNERHNEAVLRLIPTDAMSIVEVGCSGGALAREYKKINPSCHYHGIEIDPYYAELAKRHCDEVIVADVERLDILRWLFAKSCWIFADVLEHLRDPWAVLKAIRQTEVSCVIACIPNMQHWSVQARLNCGELNYEDAGLLDRTHLRWFTRKTAIDMFESTGFTLEDGRNINLPNEPVAARDNALAGIRAMARELKVPVALAVSEAMPFQYVFRVVPA